VTEEMGAVAETTRLARVGGELSAASRSPDSRSVGHGILLMLLTMVFFVGADAIAKYLTQTYPVIEVTWGRFVFHLALLLPYFAARRNLTVFRTAKLRLQLTRSLLQIGSTVLYFSAIALLPLATATVIAFAQPLLLTVFSVPLLGEKVGPRRWAAVLVGFLGVLIIVRPGGGAALGVSHCAMLLPLATAALSAFYQIATRVVTRSDPTETSLFFTAVSGAVVATIVVPFVWRTPDLAGWGLMAATGVLAGGGHYCIINAFKRAPASVLAPFSFTQLIWATALGYLVFGDLPDLSTLAGALVIIGSGLYVFYRESVRRGAAA
jgi:drug/metabolite transporter (DMT)-like permease